MEPIRVVAGVGTGPTTMAAYDAALAAANAHNYNLVAVSSVIPAEARVRVVETLPDVGAVGDCLTVVEAVAVGEREAAAALAWGRRRTGTPDRTGPGLFYEAAAADAEGDESVEDAAETGLSAGADLRGWDLTDRETLVTADTADGDPYVAAVVVAVYGSGESPL